jgi:hypothetical protein
MMDAGSATAATRNCAGAKRIRARKKSIRTEPRNDQSEDWIWRAGAQDLVPVMIARFTRYPLHEFSASVALAAKIMNKF